MRKIITTTATALALAASPVSANLQPEMIQRVSADMYQAYKEDGVYGVMEFEGHCWDDSEMTGAITQNVATLCATMAMSGVIIEASIAQSRGRQPAQFYNDGVMLSRVRSEMAKNGMGEAEFKAVMGNVLSSTPTIISGLSSAGMR